VKITTANTDASRMSVLRNPLQYGEHRNSLDSDLEKLIERNILSKEGPNRRLQALEVRAFVNSLSDQNKAKFMKVVKSIALDKENLKYFAGEIWSGGGMRVVAGCGAAVALSALELLADLNVNSYLATSAGAFQAISRLFGCLNSHLLNSTIEAPFNTFRRSRATLESWTENLIKNASGKHEVDVIRNRHVKETGSTFDVVVGETSDRILPFNYISPKIYFLFKEFEQRFGHGANNFPISKAVGITTNLPGLICSPIDTTFGNCSITDAKGKKHYLFDPGLISKYRTPLAPFLDEIEKYKAGDIKKPKIYFVVDYDSTDKSNIKKLKKEGGILPNESRDGVDFVVDLIMSIVDFYEGFTHTRPIDILEHNGLERTYINANTEAINPFTGEITVIKTGALSAPGHIRETIIGASIPLSDYKDVDNSIIDQLYTNFVLNEDGRESEFASTNGERGKSAYQLILSRINKSIGKTDESNKDSGSNDSHHSIFSAKGLIDFSTRSAAAL